MLDFLTSWFGLGLGTLGLGTLAFYLIGGAAATKALFEGLSPVLKVLGEGAATVLKKIGEILWAGISDIFDNFFTVLTVGAIAYSAYLYATLEHKIEVNSLKTQIEQLKKEKPKAKLPRNKVEGPGWFPKAFE